MGQGSFSLPRTRTGSAPLLPGAPAQPTLSLPLPLSTLQGSLLLPSFAGGWLRKGLSKAPPPPRHLGAGYGRGCPHSGLVSWKLFQWIAAGTSLPPILNPGTECPSIWRVNPLGVHSLPWAGAAELREGRLTFPPQKIDKHKYARM